MADKGWMGEMVRDGTLLGMAGAAISANKAAIKEFVRRLLVGGLLAGCVAFIGQYNDNFYDPETGYWTWHALVALFVCGLATRRVTAILTKIGTSIFGDDGNGKSDTEQDS